MEERELLVSESPLMVETVEWLVSQLEHWANTFVEWEATTEVAKRIDDGARAAYEIWNENTCVQIKERYSAVVQIQADLHKPVTEICRALTRQASLMSELTTRDRASTFNVCDGFVNEEDLKGFYAWVDMPRSNQPVGAEWAMYQLTTANNQLMTPAAEMPPDALRSGPPEKGLGKPDTSNKEKSKWTLEERRKRLRNLKDARDQLSRPSAGTTKANRKKPADASPSKSKGAKSSKMARIQPGGKPLEQTLGSILPGLAASSKQKLLGLKVGEQAPFWFLPGATGHLAVGEEAVPSSLREFFPVRGSIEVAQAPIDRSRGPSQQGTVTLTLQAEGHGKYRWGVVEALGKLGWKIE